MRVFASVLCSVALFTRLPMPRLTWDDENLRFVLAAFPVAGLVVGAAVWAWCALAGALPLTDVLAGAGIALVPLAVTGGIHLDGFADVVDARASFGDVERRREILHDPHIGAFAAIWVSAFLVATSAVGAELWQQQGPARLSAALVCVFVLSRALGGLAALMWEEASGKGLLHTVRTAARLRVSCVALLVWAAGALVALASLDVRSALVVGLVATCVWFGLRVRCARDFGGVSGDIVGHLVCVTELVCLFALALSGRVW